MSNERFTQGPWEDAGPNLDGERCIYGADDTAVAVTIPVGCPDENTARSEANARLITEAEELFDVVLEAIGYVEVEDEGGWIDRARSVIARVRGEA